MGITKEGLFKYQELTERQRKNLMILETIRKKGPVSKSELSKQLGYNIVTLSNYIEEYMKKNIVYEKGVDISTGGRRPVLLELNKGDIFLVGIDFGKEAAQAVLTDGSLNIVSELKVPRPRIEQEEVEGKIISLIEDLIKKAKVEVSKIRFVGIGIYGAIADNNVAIKGLDEEKGRSRATIYFTGLRQAIEKRFNIRAFLGTDATLAAFGERALNPYAEVDNLLYMFQDIGKGIVIKGEVYCSTDLGSVDLEGVIGSLNEEERSGFKEESLYLRPWNSKMSLRNEAKKVIERGVGTKIVELLKGDLNGLDEEVILKAAVEQDDIAVELVESIGINLGVRIAYLVNLFAPQVVIVGGGIEKAGEILFEQIEKTIEKLSLEKIKQSVKVVPSILGSRAVSLGAAAVALRELFLEA